MIFTHHLLEGLLGGAVNFSGDVTVGSLYEHVWPAFEAEVKQKPLLRGDVGGRVVLGSNFAPRVGAPVPAEGRTAILSEARELLTEYAGSLSKAQTHWKESGHRQCSQDLTGIVRWFSTQLSTHAELANDAAFQALQLEVRTKVSQLGNVDVGTRTTRGVLTSKLGSGGFGSVWRVDSTDRPPLAVKIFHAADFGEKDKLELFHRGYRAMAKLDHPRVVGVYEYTTAPIGFVMDFIDGPNVRQLPDIVTEPAELLRILILAAETIQHAHSRGVIHRDIKPENMLLSYEEATATWLPYLTDFDLAWFSTATSITEKSFGNLYYAAPEQLARPHSNAARRSSVDIYAFGQLAYFSITGSNPVPFGTEQNISVLKERMASWPSGLAAQRVAAWYERATAENPDDRFKEFQSLASELAAAEIAARAHDMNTELTRMEFVQEVAFGVSGFAATAVEEGQTIWSIAGRTELSFSTTMLSTTRASQQQTLLSAILPLATLEVTGVSSERAKALLLGRVNAIIGSYTNISRKVRTDGAFSVEVRFTQQHRDYESVLFVRDVLGRIVDAIER